ncbi:hypothetical protein Tco_1153599 [Tanacetum coccineum]
MHHLLKEVSEFATHVIQSTITESLENVILAKSSCQLKSTYEAATSLTEDLYDALVKSYNLDKDLFESYGKSYSLKRDLEDKDNDEDPTAGSDQWLKKWKTSKDVEPSKGSKSKESKLSSSKGTKLSQNHLNNPEGHEYPFDLSKPLPLIEDRGRQVVLVNYFINNNLEYLKGGSSSMKYTTSTTKTKATKYDDIQGIKDMVPSLWSPVKKSKHDVFSTKRIIVVTHVKVMRWYDYGYLEEIEVRREDRQLYKFREGNFPRLNLRDIKDMLLILVQKKLSNLERDVIFDLNVALRMFTRRVVILKRVEDLQLAVKSYQKKLNITKPKMFRSDTSNMTPYTAYNNPQGIVYLDKLKRNRLMCSDELYKFCDGTLISVRSVLHDIASRLRIDYLPKRN